MSKIIYLFHEGIRNLWRHKITAVTAIGSVFFSLLIIGTFILVHQNSHQLIDYIRSKYKIEVFFEDHVTNEDAQLIVDQIKELDGVQSIALITKDNALKIYQEQFNENLIEILGYNPLPNSAVINIEKHGNTEVDVGPLITDLEKIPNIDEVVYEGTLIRRVEYFYNITVRIISYIAIGLLVITIIVISNTIKLSVYAKQDLIQNLKSIGATKRFIRTPFIIEGILEGLIGAFLAIAVLFIALRSANIYFTNIISFKIDFDIVGIIWLFAIAIFMGVIGSYRGIRTLLK
ncbi:MAG: ABC transporter permease [Candidatus Marinimicrobia bacterium]|nr:ABC transporter permease [Candidatus Neomarinimicrobiota bacterium]